MFAFCIQVRGESCVSSGYSTEEEGVNPKQNKDPVLPDMSGFYYTTQQHHRDGPKPRGRPPFSHKAAKSLSEKRGRGVGRPLGRTSAVRDRDSQEEHGYDLEKKNHSQLYRHGDMPRQGRYGPPNRVPKRTDEIEADKVPPAPRNTPSKTLVANEESNAAAKLAKMQRRDAPREKQRLTQDLARQKRLLSEDIARAQLLHREQLSKKLESTDKKEQSGEREDLSDLSKDELQLFSHIHEDARKEKVTTMYEKVYGRFSPDLSPEMVKDRAHFEEMLAEVQRKDKNLNYNQERKSIFERFKMSKEGVQEMKNIEFVNEAKIEVRGVNCSIQNNGIVDTNAIQKLEPLKFENVTDDELVPSDNENGGKPVNYSTFGSVNGELGEAQCNHDSGNVLHFLDKNSGDPHELENNIECGSERDINDADQNQESVFEKVDCMTCKCADDETAVGEGEGYKVLFSDGNNSLVSELKSNPDHSNIKTASKIEQLLEEPDMQCEHSSKHCNDTDDVISDQFQEKGTESDTPRDACDSVDITAGAQMENSMDGNEVKAVAGVESNVSETGMASPTQTQDSTECVHSEENTTEGIRGDVETDLSNNEGMSDAEELSDSDVYTAPQRGKVKKRRKRKHKSAKARVNSPVKATTSSVLKGRPKSSRAGGRGKKSTRKPKPIPESDSDDAFGYSAKPGNSAEKLGGDEEHIPYQGQMVKEDSSSDPPPVLFEDSADINGTFDSALANSCSSKRDTDNQAALKDESSLKDEEEKGESMEEVDKNSKIDQELSPATSEHHNSAGETGDSGQDIFSLTSAERQLFEEQEKKEKMRKEKRFAARQKRRNEEQKEKERSTPPHLVSQNRFARDLPRHNWLVERLLQQKRLCEDTLGEESASNNDGKAVEGNEDVSTAEKEEKEEKSDSNEIAQNTDEFPKSEQEKQCEAGDSTGDEDSNSTKDEFQTELHRSFLRRRYPANVPRGPPKLKPAIPDFGKISESGPPPLNSLKHKLLSPKDCPTMEPIPKLRKINGDGDKSDSSADTVRIESRLDSDANQPQNEDLANVEEPNSKEKESLQSNITPIEILNSDDEEERKNYSNEKTSYLGEELSHDETRPESKTSETESRENVFSPSAKESSNFSSPKKPLPQKIVNSVSPTIHSNKPKDVQSPQDKLSPSMHMSPHHRAAILIPLMPMHEGGLPVPPSMGPPSPHMKAGYPPRTFAPHLISHSSSALQPPGLFPNPLSPSGRYPANACMHHMHGGMKTGMPCKRDVNCPFHGSTPRGMHSGILGIPSHHGSIPTFSQHSHISEHMPPIFSCEHREGEKAPCTRPDCKPCHVSKESPNPKHREPELGNSAKISPQIPKVVKPIAHVPGKRPPLMLSHLQQLHSSRHPPNIESYHGDKDRRPTPGLESLLPGNQQKSPEKSIRDNATTGFPRMSDKRLFNQPLTLSELNRRREEEEILKTRMGERGPEQRHRPGEFVMPRLSPPPRSTSKSSGNFSQRDSATLLSGRSPPLKEAEILRRFGRERERALLLPEHLKTGPPRLCSVEDPRELADLRIMAERQRREEIAMREVMLAKENPALLHQIRGASSPQARLFEKTKSPRLMSEQAREGLELSRARLHPAHGNASVFSLGSPAHALGELSKNTEETRKGVGRDEQHGLKDTRNPEVNPPHRNCRPGHKNAALHELERGPRLDLFNSKEQEKKEPVEKEHRNRSPSKERERQGERLNVDRDKSPFRLPAMSPPSLRKDAFSDRLLTMDPRGRPQHRVDPRVMSLQELEIHRRREEPSHRELLSRMAMSSRGAGPHLLTPFLDRKEGLFEGPEHLRLPLGLRRGSPPRNLPRDFPPSPSSRLAVERLAAAAAQAKPGHLLNEKNKDIPPHLREVSVLDVLRSEELLCSPQLLRLPS